MPVLNWATKTDPHPIRATLKLDSIIYPQGKGYPGEPAQHTLMIGDNLAAIWALLPEFEGRIHLIYADPPFFTNRRYPARVGRGEDSRRPSEWQLVEGYPDHWPSLDAYLDMLYPRLVLMHRLLAPTGTLYLHLDWHANAYARLLLDEIFGPEYLLNEIIWVYHGPSPIRSAFNRKHDTILAYTKSDSYTFNVDAVRQPYDPSTVKTFASSPKAGFGKIPDLKRGKVPEDWWYFPVVARLHNERSGYPTQKPQALLERIVLASSNPGELVADFFCGSGTTAAAATRLGRQFLGGDVAARAVHTTTARLAASSTAPFSLQRVLLPGQPIAAAVQPPIVDPGIIQIERLASSLRVKLASDLLDPLDYWEVDPSWEGGVFHSAGQAIRPRRKGNLPGELCVNTTSPAGRVCVRMVFVDGGAAQAVV